MRLLLISSPPPSPSLSSTPFKANADDAAASTTTITTATFSTATSPLVKRAFRPCVSVALSLGLLFSAPPTQSSAAELICREEEEQVVELDAAPPSPQSVTNEAIVEEAWQIVNDSFLDTSPRHRWSPQSWLQQRDSKEEMGYVGLKNQGATCYLNSLLQTWYHLPCLRKAIYKMATTAKKDMPLALQSLFYEFENSGCSVSAEEFTSLFGWNPNDQQDVHEFSSVLSRRLEDKMKGTVVEGTIAELFGGRLVKAIECINVDRRSSIRESFYGCKDVYDSLEKYVEVERLEGDDKHDAGRHGLQDAMKSVRFINFPPVPQLQLMRFQYDGMQGTAAKVNDRYEFPFNARPRSRGWKISFA